VTHLSFISIPKLSKYCDRWLITALIFILLAIFACNIVGAAGTNRKLISERCAVRCEETNPVRWAHFDTAGQKFTTGSYNPAAPLTQGAPRVISFAQSAFSVNEGGGPAMFKLTRTGGTDGAVTAKISLTDGTAGTADYRYNPGDLDTTFPPYPHTSFGLPYNSMLVVLPDGKLLVSANTGVVRLNADGTTDANFNALGVANNTVYTMAQQPDGKVIIGGGFTSIGSIRRNRIARLNANGTLDTTFDAGVGPDNEVDYIALQPDGKMIIVGYFSYFNGEYRSAARLNPDGSLDPSFTFTDGTFVKKIIVQPDGKILMVGSVIRRLNPDGTFDNTFVRNASPVNAREATLLPDGRMLISGAFSQIDGQTIYNVARLMPDGSLDPTFSTGTGPDKSVAAVAAQADGKVIIAGYFRAYNNAPVSAPVIRLNVDGSLDTTFNAPATASSTDNMTAMAVQPDGHVIVSGYFNIFAGSVYRGNFARLRGDLFATWNNGDAGDKTISLPIVDDLLDEADETLNLTVTPLTGGVATGTYPTATLTIVDNDVPPAITSGPPPALVNSGNVEHVFTATGFPVPTFSVSGGTLPPGLFLSPSGQLYGFARTPGSYNNIAVTANNGVAPVATQTFNIRVNAIPSGNFDSYSVNEDNTLAVAAPGVLGNDTDQDQDPLTAVLVSSTNRGTLTLQPDGSFTYMPVPNFAGTDSFVYYVTDGNIRSSSNVSVQLNVNAVNDAPVNTVPGAQSTYDNAPLVFSTANNNLISVADIDANFGAFRITLAATKGTVTLKSTSGLTFVTGDGTADANIIFAGSLPSINNALNGMSFNPSLGSNGAAGLQITSNDQGNTGTGGALSDTDAVSINVLASTVQFSAASYQFGEGDVRATFTVMRSGNLATTAAVDFTTVDDAAAISCADTVNNHGAAYARCDYATVVSTVTFAAGEASKTISVPLIDDAQVEGAETFHVQLAKQVGVGALSMPDVTVTIQDNDTGQAANPVFDNSFFVRLQYLDFLSREPEQSGYDAWLRVLNKCGDVNNTDPNSPNAGCDRITVSSAFFGSQEFQLKGYYVYRFYKLSFDRLPEYTEIVPDMSAVSGATAAEVYAKKAAFANAFVLRPAFANSFGTRTNADYVTALMGRYGLSSITTPDPAAPDGATKLTLSSVDLINRLTAGTLTRAQVLRAIADSDQVGALEFNRAFVAMQYYGYLRRTPETGGYNAWLNYLNAHPTDSRTMVNGFMNSTEYRLRFGQP